MKLSSAKLGDHLAKQLLPIYLISGDEPLLKHEAMQLIRKAGIKAGIHEKTRLTPGVNFNWDELYSLLYGASLFAEKCLLEFDFKTERPNKTANEMLKEYAKAPIAEKTIVFDLGKIDDKITKTEWYVACEKIGLAITCWPITRDELPQWIKTRAKKYKLTIDQEALHLLTDYVEGNLIAAAQTLEKIYLLQPEKTVDIPFLKNIIIDESHYTIFDFMENLIAGNTARTIHILNALQTEGTEPALILWGITRELRLLAALGEKRKHGETDEALFKKYRIFFRRQAAYRYFLNKFSPKDCWHLMVHANEIDRILKGAKTEDIWRSLEIFCLRWSQK